MPIILVCYIYVHQFCFDGLQIWTLNKKEIGLYNICFMYLLTHYNVSLLIHDVHVRTSVTNLIYYVE